MLKLGVVSDTHKHITNLSRALDFLKSEGASMFIHLGDDYTDPEEIGEHDFVRIPGVFSATYTDESIPNRLIKNVVGWRLFLTHTLSSHPNDLPGDIRPEDIINGRRADAVFFGHTHVPEIKEDYGIVFMNPGHLKNDDKRGSPPTFAYIELSMNRMIIRIHKLLEFEILKEHTFRR
ncbi:MAG: metallophosphoesterase family protein [candidate division WOR-3 bacterium]|nr:MAG: metallophosphoesterase family protein [candidate division WOR-3 bacterium]